jgi:hypothetical protein
LAEQVALKKYIAEDEVLWFNAQEQLEQMQSEQK